VIVIHSNHPKARKSADELIAAIRKLLDDLDASAAKIRKRRWTGAVTDEGNLLHVLVCDGTKPAKLAPEIYDSAKAADRVWILPLIRHKFITRVSKLLDGELQKRNVAFWEDKIEELGLVVLARAGITCLDRKVFVSYRRSDTSPIADQLFDELSRRNFQVFLDRVSVDPGVDFQASLFEQLAGKSMVVLNSKEFPASRWTMEEIRFARQHRLSVLILRLPDAQDDLGGTASEVVNVKGREIHSVSVPGFKKRQARFKQGALKAMIDRIVREHDLMLIGRIRNIRDCIIAAAARRRPKIKYAASKYDSSIKVKVPSAGGASRQYVIYPSPYPPWVAELFDASIRTVKPPDTSRIIIGHAASLLPLRVKQLNWIVDGRNVNYHDVGSLDGLFDKLV
jgi:hypothetical protein